MRQKESSWGVTSQGRWGRRFTAKCGVQDVIYSERQMTTTQKNKFTSSFLHCCCRNFPLNCSQEKTSHSHTKDLCTCPHLTEGEQRQRITSVLDAPRRGRQGEEWETAHRTPGQDARCSRGAGRHGHRAPLPLCPWWCFGLWLSPSDS